MTAWPEADERLAEQIRGDVFELLDGEAGIDGQLAGRAAEAAKRAVLAVLSGETCGGPMPEEA